METVSEPYGLDVDRRVAPFEAAAILGALAVTFPWHRDLTFAVVLMAVICGLGAALLLGALRGWPRWLNTSLGCLALGLTLWPWGGANPVPRALVALGIVAICTSLNYLPWDRLPVTLRLAVPGGAAVMVGIFAGANAAPPYLTFPLLLLVVLWTALYHQRTHVAAVLAACVAIQGFISTQERSWLVEAPLYGGMLVLVGGSVHVLVHRSRQERGMAEAVAVVLRSLAEGSESSSIRQSLCGTLVRLLGAPSVCIFELDEEAERLVPTAGEPRLPPMAITLEGEVIDADGRSAGVPTPRPVMLEAFTTRKPAFRPRLKALARTGELARVEQDFGAMSTYCQPVLRNGRTVAVLAVTWQRERVDVPAPEARLIEALANEVGLLLQQADLQGRVEALARTDALTEVANRRHWEAELGAALTRARREGSPVCVAIIDLDDFKSVNDNQGHHVGDRLLRDFATHWEGGLRSADVLGRYGGDEFALLLPNCEAEEALDVVERLRTLSAGEGPFSAGLAQWDGYESDADLLQRADAALYDAKGAGGGQSSVAHDRTAAAAAWVRAVHAALGGAPIATVLQPIRRLEDGAVVGWEALSRFEGLEEHVEPLFQAARRLGVSRDLDWLCRRAAIEQSTGIAEPIFINTTVWSLLDPRHSADELAALLAEGGRTPSNVVLELSERDRLGDVRVVEAIRGYRMHGFRFALDDLGAGHSTLEMLVRIEASFFKIASTLLQAADERSLAVVRALAHFAEQTGGEVIAEGLQSKALVKLALGLGITLGQGYQLGRPEPAAAARSERPPVAR